MWQRTEKGKTVGTEGPHAGRISRDETRDLARIFMEVGGNDAPFAITCSIEGWMVHCRFNNSEQAAAADFERMRDALTLILDLLTVQGDAVTSKDYLATAAIAKFVESFP